MQEIYYSGGFMKGTYAYENQPDELYATAQEHFPWVKKEEHFSISTPVYHEVLEEEVMTLCLPLQHSWALVGPKAALTSRKLCMQSKTSFLRSYELYEGPALPWLPAEARLFGTGINMAEFGRPAPPKAMTFQDFYFGGDCAAIEAAFNLPVKRGAYDTWYGATVVDGVVTRVKQYCYDDQTTFSDWDIGFIVHCKRINRVDLLEIGEAEKVSVDPII